MPGKNENANQRISNTSRGRVQLVQRQMVATEAASTTIIEMPGEGPDDCNFLADGLAAMCTLIADAEAAKIALAADLARWLEEA